MIAETNAFTIDGTTARSVRIEVDVQRGLPAFQVVGLPDAAVRETRERVRASLVNCGFEFPLRRITANLAPADLRKTGPGLDLAIAAALLAAAGEISKDDIEGWTFIGELALDGTLRPVRGALAMAEAARAIGSRGIVVPPGNGAEAALAHGIAVRTINDVSQLRTFVRGGDQGDPAEPLDFTDMSDAPDLADLRGQQYLVKALEVAAAGGHGLLMIGPPGSGKSLAARRLPSILPPLDGAEILEVARIASVSGLGVRGITGKRPFRAPHHTVSAAGLVGGGSPTRPGEITLAHKGVLFLDELVEFRRSALEALRQPLETGQIEIARGAATYTMPADFQLVAAANPCPCGRGENDANCDCSDVAIRRYRSVLSGALTDRIDIHLGVGQPTAADLAGSPGESSATVRDRVIAARERMSHRYGSNRTNSNASPNEVAAFDLTPEALEVIYDDNFLSGRSIARVMALGRTLADLADSAEVREDDVSQALAYTCRPQCASV